MRRPYFIAMRLKSLLRLSLRMNFYRPETPLLPSRLIIIPVLFLFSCPCFPFPLEHLPCTWCCLGCIVCRSPSQWRLRNCEFAFANHFLLDECSHGYSTCYQYLGPQNREVLSRAPCTQYGHSTCALFSFPHAEHLVKCVTSFNALPAICRCLFFI